MHPTKDNGCDIGGVIVKEDLVGSTLFISSSGRDEGLATSEVLSTEESIGTDTYG